MQTDAEKELRRYGAIMVKPDWLDMDELRPEQREMRFIGYEIHLPKLRPDWAQRIAKVVAAELQKIRAENPSF